MSSTEELCVHCNQKLPAPKRKASEPYIKMAEAFYSVTFQELKQKTKAKRISDARAYLWFLLCIDGYWSLTEASYKLSEGMPYNFDHTSVLYQVRKKAVELYGMSMKASIKEIRAEHEKFR